VSIEDIVEQIVGDIEDEHDEDARPSVIRLPDGSFLADARAALDDVTTTVGPEFDIGDLADEVDTLGGYLVMQFGRVPVRGELIPGPTGFEIEVLDADPRRVKRVKIYRGKDRSRRAKRRDGRPDNDNPQAPVNMLPAPPDPNASRPDAIWPSSDAISS
jgi:CBS domain containing-hemolysin-like protein